MNAVDYFFEVSKNSERIFILNKNEEITHAALYEKTSKLSHVINGTFGTGNIFLVCSANSLFFVLCYLAIIKSGNVCVPVNVAASESTLDFIRKETKPVKIFTQKKYARLFPNSDHDIYTENEINNLIQKADENNKKLDLATDPDQLAEIIYTSGSTAAPKGVMISHKNLIANTSSIVEYLRLTEEDKMLVVLPFHYCYGLSLLHTHLRVGGAIVLNNSFMLLGNVINDLKKYNCTGFAGVPSHFQILMRKSDSFINNQFDNLRYVTQAGGKLHNVFIEEFVHHFPLVNFFVMYGQTEATARLTYLPFEKLKDKLGSIGIPIPGVEIKLVNPEGIEVQIGETGEIVAKGDNIMKGYYNDLEMTQKTIEDGFLKTGDLAKMDNDGYIYLVARKKEIIKVGGERVSPKEIENVIVNIPEVLDCTIEAVDDEILGEKIKATIVLKNTESLQQVEEKIIAICKQKLSPIKIPQLFQFIDQLNVSASGKKVKNTE
jgi:long-chain acyl-CoA synthetase